MVAQRGLGRGLGALFQDEPLTRRPSLVSAGDNAADAASKDAVSRLPLAAIAPNPNQPRKDFEPGALEDLAASIREQGLLQPILVRPLPGGANAQGAESGTAATGVKYEIVAGERRWRASKLAGLTEVPVLVRELNEQQTLALALIENLQREDLNALEEALGIERLKSDFGLSQEEVARQLGKSRSAVANCLRLLNLPPAVQEDLRQGRISQGHARALLSFENATEQEKARCRILEEGLSVRMVEALAYESKQASIGGQAIGSGLSAGSDFAAGADQVAGSDLAPGAASSVNTEPGQIAGQAAGLAAEPLEHASGLITEQGAGLANGKTLEAAEAVATGDLPGKAGRAKPQSVVLLDLQAKISSAVKLPVKISGRENKGRLNISYSSKEELQGLLQRLGL